MNTVALGKALKFACVPTLSLLALLFFGFFSITKTIEFIASDNGWAITLRIVAFLAEVILIATLYDKYKTDEILKGNGDLKSKREVSYRKEVYDIKSNWSSNDTFFMHDTDDSNIVCIQRVPKNTNY